MNDENERVQRILDMIDGIAWRKKDQLPSYSHDELVNELWIAYRDAERKAGKDLDLNLIADICYKKIVDLVRYNVTRSDQVPVDPTNLDFIDDTDDESENDRKGEFKRSDSAGDSMTPNYKNNEYMSGSDFDRAIAMKELLTHFPAGSKERLFLEFWATDAGIIHKDFNVEKYNGSSLADLLGYSGTSSGGYKVFVNNMQVFVTDWFGVNMKDYQKEKGKPRGRGSKE